MSAVQATAELTTSESLAGKSARDNGGAAVKKVNYRSAPDIQVIKGSYNLEAACTGDDIAILWTKACKLVKIRH